ncbi:MAG: hypothetical protein E3K32_12690 [wastewater metagenome]|nr:hypothetical protein [Candidatus Loosdrechtia aerotolerans]
MFFVIWQKRVLLLYSIIVVCCAAFLLERDSITFAQDDPPSMRLVRIIESDYPGIANPAGLVFSPKAKNFFVMRDTRVSPPSNGGSDVTKITLFEDPAGSVRVPLMITDPVNMTFDWKANRLLILQSNTRNLFEIRANTNGSLNTKKITRYGANDFDLQDPQGVTVNPANGHLFILDSAMKRIVHVEPNPDQSFHDAAVSYIDLKQRDIPDLRGIALNPNNSHLYLLSPSRQELYEFTQAGQFVSVRDLSELELKDPQGMVFALTGDLTADPTKMSLYIADSCLTTRQNQNTRSFKDTQSPGQRNRGEQLTGMIIELSLR